MIGGQAATEIVHFVLSISECRQSRANCHTLTHIHSSKCRLVALPVTMAISMMLLLVCLKHIDRSSSTGLSSRCDSLACLSDRTLTRPWGLGCGREALERLGQSPMQLRLALVPALSADGWRLTQTLEMLMNGC
jgi:hypothetical protein